MLDAPGFASIGGWLLKISGHTHNAPIPCNITLVYLSSGLPGRVYALSGLNLVGDMVNLDNVVLNMKRSTHLELVDNDNNPLTKHILSSLFLLFEP